MSAEQLAIDGAEDGAAIFSPCGLYRYALERRLRPGTRRLVMLLVNPSKADAKLNDPTARRCIGFAWSLGFDVLTIVNLFALIDTDVRGLLKAADPIGPENDRHLADAIRRSDMVIAGWGAKSGRLGRLIRKRAEAVVSRISPARLFVLRWTKNGAPEHPLMLPADLRPRLYCAPAPEPKTP